MVVGEEGGGDGEGGDVALMKDWKTGGRDGGLFSCLAAVLDSCHIPAILVTAERSISFYGKEEVTLNAGQL